MLAAMKRAQAAVGKNFFMVQSPCTPDRLGRRFQEVSCCGDCAFLFLHDILNQLYDLSFECVRELEDNAGNWQHHIDELSLFVAFEVDTSPGDIARRNRSCGKIMLRGRPLCRFALGSFLCLRLLWCSGHGCLDTGCNCWRCWGLRWRSLGSRCGGSRCRWREIQLRWRNV